jgi:hypothetical protein
MYQSMLVLLNCKRKRGYAACIMAEAIVHGDNLGLKTQIAGPEHPSTKSSRETPNAWKSEAQE